MIKWIKNYTPLINDKHPARNLVLFVPEFILGVTCIILCGVLTRFPNDGKIALSIIIIGGILIAYGAFFIFDLTMSNKENKKEKHK